MLDQSASVYLGLSPVGPGNLCRQRREQGVIRRGYRAADACPRRRAVRRGNQQLGSIEQALRSHRLFGTESAASATGSALRYALATVFFVRNKHDVLAIPANRSATICSYFINRSSGQLSPPRPGDGSSQIVVRTHSPSQSGSGCTTIKRIRAGSSLWDSSVFSSARLRSVSFHRSMSSLQPPVFRRLRLHCGAGRPDDCSSGAATGLRICAALRRLTAVGWSTTGVRKRLVVGAHAARYADRNFGTTTAATRAVSITSVPVAASAGCTPKVSAAPPRAR